MNLDQGNNFWFCGWVKKEAEEIVAKTVELDNRKKYGVLEEEGLPQCNRSGEGSSQARTLASCQVLESARLVSTARHFAVSCGVTRPVSPKPAGPVSATKHPGLDSSFLHFIWGATCSGPDWMGLTKGHELSLKHVQ